MTCASVAMPLAIGVSETGVQDDQRISATFVDAIRWITTAIVRLAGQYGRYGYWRMTFLPCLLRSMSLGPHYLSSASAR